MNTKDNRLLILSYAPLLRITPEQAGITNPKAILALADQTPDIKVYGCIWVKRDNSLHPVLVIDRMTEVVDHLEEWCEGVPQERMELYIRYIQSKNKYIVALTPKYKKALERARINIEITHHMKIPDKTKIVLLFKPLVFISDKYPKTFLQIQNNIENKVYLSLVDIKDFNQSTNLQDLDQSKLRTLGLFDVNTHDDSGLLNNYAE